MKRRSGANGKRNSSTRQNARSNGSGSRAGSSFVGSKKNSRGERGAAKANDNRSRLSSSAAGRVRFRWVVGIHSCEEVLKVRPQAIQEAVLRDDWSSSHILRELAEVLERKGVAIKSVPQGQLDKIGSGHQGLALAVGEDPVFNLEQMAGQESAIVIALDEIEDPHNLGSILRTSWLTGVSAILIPDDRAVGLTPAVSKIASGGAEHVPVERCGNLAAEIQRLKDLGFWVFGLSEKGTALPWAFDLPKKIVWVVGSEGSGLRVTTERSCDELVRIPQVKTGSSYNASIAIAMALTETCRQLGKPD